MPMTKQPFGTRRLARVAAKDRPISPATGKPEKPEEYDILLPTDEGYKVIGYVQRVPVGSKSARDHWRPWPASWEGTDIPELITDDAAYIKAIEVLVKAWDPALVPPTSSASTAEGTPTSQGGDATPAEPESIPEPVVSGTGVLSGEAVVVSASDSASVTDYAEARFVAAEAGDVAGCTVPGSPAYAVTDPGTGVPMTPVEHPADGTLSQPLVAEPAPAEPEAPAENAAYAHTAGFDPAVMIPVGAESAQADVPPPVPVVQVVAAPETPAAEPLPPAPAPEAPAQPEAPQEVPPPAPEGFTQAPEVLDAPEGTAEAGDPAGSTEPDAMWAGSPLADTPPAPPSFPPPPAAVSDLSWLTAPAQPAPGSPEPENPFEDPRVIPYA